MEIRLFTAKDYDGALALWQSTPGVGLRSLDDSPEGIAKFLLRNPNTSFAAEHEGKIVGVILCGHDGRRGYIYHVCVIGDCRGKSLGRELVSRALGALKKEGINKAALVCFGSNYGGNKFWESIGWEKRGDLNYYNISLNDGNT